MKPKVLVAFAAGYPKAERAWVARLIRKCARTWDVEGYEYQVAARRMGSTLGMCTVKVLSMATIVEVTLHSARFADRDAMRVDLIHELLHVFDEEARNALVDLAAHIPDAKRRARALRLAERRYEALHDKHARMWSRTIGRKVRR